MEKFEESFKMFNQLNDKEKEFSKKLDGLLKVYTLGNPEELGLNFLNDEDKKGIIVKSIDNQKPPELALDRRILLIAVETQVLQQQQGEQQPDLAPGGGG